MVRNTLVSKPSAQRILFLDGDTEGDTPTSPEAPPPAAADRPKWLPALRCHTLQEAFRPLYVVCRVAGLMFEWPVRDSNKVSFVFSLVYYGLVLIFAWANVLRYCFAYQGDAFSPELIVKAGYHVVYIQTAFSCLAFTKVSVSRERLLAKWTAYHDTFNLDPSTVTQVIRKRSIVLMSAAFMCLPLVSVLLFTLEPLTTSPITYLNAKPFVGLNYTDAGSLPLTWRLAAFALYAFEATVYALYLTWLILVGLALQSEYVLIQRDFREMVRSQPLLNLEHVRQRHLALSDIVAEVDDVVSFNVLSIFVCYLPMVCFSIYQMVLWDLVLEASQLVWCVIFSLLVSVAPMCIIIFVGTKLNDAACCLKKDLYRLRLDNEDQWGSLPKMQYCTFLNHLKSGDIGFTAWQLFVIKRSTLKMTILMIISYTVILMKFGTVASTVSCQQKVPMTPTVPDHNPL